MIPLSEYRDEHGVITQHPSWGGDAGDSAHRHGVEFLFKNYPSKGIDYFFTPDGRLIRHRDGAQPWTRELDRGSRDQNVVWLCAFTVQGLRANVKDIAKLVMGNYSRFTNTKKNGLVDTPDKFPDIAGPEVWALFIRGMRLKLLYPLLYIFDLETLFGSIAWNHFRATKDTDNTNHICILKASNEVMPTFVSRLALRVLNKERAILKLKNYWDVPGYSLEPNKDPAVIGSWIVEYLRSKNE